MVMAPASNCMYIHTYRDVVFLMRHDLIVFHVMHTKCLT